MSNFTPCEIVGCVETGKLLEDLKQYRNSDVSSIAPVMVYRIDFAIDCLQRCSPIKSVPILKNIDSTILTIIESGQGSLNMSDYHSCDTTHCRAGWADFFAGNFADTHNLPYSTAGVVLYFASTGRVPDFFCSNEEALADIRRCAALEQERAVTA